MVVTGGKGDTIHPNARGHLARARAVFAALAGGREADALTFAGGGGATEAELFVPYAAMRARAWPQSGDLELSLVWMHRHADGRTTRLVWSEDGYAWTPRWFGVVRRGPGELPRMVRIK